MSDDGDDLSEVDESLPSGDDPHPGHDEPGEDADESKAPHIAPTCRPTLDIDCHAAETRGGLVA
jgi:hypothetical protein